MSSGGGSRLVLPAMIELRDDDGARLAIAGVALIVLLISIAYSKRSGGAFTEEDEVVEEALVATGAPEGASAGE